MKETKHKPRESHEPREAGPDVASTSKVNADADRAEPGAPAQRAEEAGPEDPVKKLEARIDALEDGILRAKADYQNLQRRSAAERLDAVRYANAELMRSLVAVADDFERALESCRKHESAEAIAEGVQIVYDHFTKALHDQGLEPIEALHRSFDPAVHEAMMQQPTQEQPPGTVVEEVAKGYRLHDRVIRPAKVVVATAPQEAQSGE